MAEDDVFWNLNKFWHLWTSLNNSLNFILLRHYQMTLLEEESFCVLRWKLGSKMWQEWAHTISDTTNCFSFDYFIGRNCCGKKMLRGKSRNFCNFFFRKNIIFCNSHLFLPATYTLRVIIDVAPLINVLIFFLQQPPPYSNPPPLFNIFSNLFEPNFFFHSHWLIYMQDIIKSC